jgi:gas vesicle protein
MKLSSFLVGVGIGATVALLFAPRSGEETREMISEKAEEGRRYAKARVQDLRDAAGDTVEQGKKVARRKVKAVAAAAEAAQDTYQSES